jgi:hypothetical protein
MPSFTALAEFEGILFVAATLNCEVLHQPKACGDSSVSDSALVSQLKTCSAELGGTY